MSLDTHCRRLGIEIERSRGFEGKSVGSGDAVDFFAAFNLPFDFPLLLSLPWDCLGHVSFPILWKQRPLSYYYP
jgi:hypothetical protein